LALPYSLSSGPICICGALVTTCTRPGKAMAREAMGCLHLRPEMRPEGSLRRDSDSSSPC